MKILNILLVISLLCFGNLFAQTPFCGFDKMKNSTLESSPELRMKEEQMNLAIYESIIQNKTVRNTGGTLIIPIVFHIMHNNGTENIADSVVVNALTELNLRFQNAAPYFDSTGTRLTFNFVWPQSTHSEIPQME
ncbi:MAG: hypothetical protein JNL49_11380 [Bacteroidia bacterium]|nr:hypothetical protein [Bacteroidia bacterium]